MANASGIISSLAMKVSEWQFEYFPEFAMYIGMESDESSLDPYNLQVYADRKNLCQEVLDALEPLKEEGLSHEDIITLHMLKYYSTMYIKSLEWEPYLMGLNFWEGPDWVFTSNIPRATFKTETHYINYIARLEKLPKAFEEITGLMKLGAEKSITHYKPSVEGAINRLRNFTNTEIRDSIFFSPFLKIPETISEQKRIHLRALGEELVQSKIYPSFQRTADFISQVYTKSCRPQPALSSLPGGKERYLAYLCFFSDWYGTAEELHELGKQEVNKINKRIEQIKENIGFCGDHVEFMKFLEEKEEFFLKSMDEMVAYCDDLIKNRIRPKLKPFFSEPPILPLRYEVWGKSLPAPAAYNAPMKPSANEEQEGLLVFKDDVRSLPTYMLPSLMLHETDPGHHLQACFTVTNEALPTFRRYKDDRRYFECPARFPMNVAYTEGWGLYAECLGEEMGVYEDDYDLLGYLMQDIKRALRVVVDTGIHAFGWSEETAFDYMKKNAPYGDSDARGEIKRYITWPGQACAYKVGYLKIASLRKKAETTLGERFCIKKFHEVCLKCGQVPLDTLEAIVDQYIKEAQQ